MMLHNVKPFFPSISFWFCKKKDNFSLIVVFRNVMRQTALFIGAWIVYYLDTLKGILYNEEFMDSLIILVITLVITFVLILSIECISNIKC